MTTVIFNPSFCDFGYQKQINNLIQKMIDKNNKCVIITTIFIFFRVDKNE